MRVTRQHTGVFAPLQSAILLVLMKDSMTSHSGHDEPGQLISLYLDPAMTLMPTTLYASIASFANINCDFCSQTQPEVKRWYVYMIFTGKISLSRFCPCRLRTDPFFGGYCGKGSRCGVMTDNNTSSVLEIVEKTLLIIEQESPLVKKEDKKNTKMWNWIHPNIYIFY